nr:DUF2147 domain-containing protein [Methylobacterium sp. ZNC0032]
MRHPLLALTFIVASSAAALSSDIDGTWLRDDGNARVKIAPCGNKICATNLWIGDTSQGEAAGDQLVMTLERQSDGSFNGSAFDAKRDRTYAMTITTSPGALKTRGCIVGGLLCRNVNWKAAQ